MDCRVQRGYPYVTAKCAVSFDGRVAGAKGLQLTGSVANVYAHALRARVGGSSWVREPFWPTIRS